MERKMFDTPVLPRLATILAEVKSGDLVVPAFQRPFVWDDDRRLSLLDSISQGMPVGSLLVWRTGRKDLETYESVGGIGLDVARRGDEKINYLLDGHQRISTLFGALQAGPRGPASPDDDTRWEVYYELGSKERPAFRLKPRRGEPPPHWLPLEILFDGDRLFDFTQALRAQGKRDLARQAESLANVFKDYIIPVVPLVTEELDTVTDAFVRINSQGKGMSEAHMLRALTHLKSTDTDRRFTEVRARLQVRGWGGLDEQVLVNVLKAMLELDVYAAGARRVHELLAADPRPLDALGPALEEAAEALFHVGVCGPGALPYAYQFVVLAAVAAKSPGVLLQSGAAEKIRWWFWCSTYGEHFTGATGSRIRGTIGFLPRLLKGDVTPDMPRDAEPLLSFWPSSVRARAFLLFLAERPGSAEARLRRRRLLGVGDARGSALLYSGVSPANPSNHVIAGPEELRDIRTALKSGQGLTPEMADEFAIPEEAVRVIPDRDAFLEARRKWLFEREKEFIASFCTPPPTQGRSL